MASPHAFPDETARALENDLKRRIEGEVRFDRGSRALYATDASNYRQVPIGVVVPKTVEDVVATMAACRRHGAPVLARGGGTSLAGQCCNVAVVIDCSKYLRRVLSIDPQRRLALVEPGCVLDHLRAEAEKHHLTFGPDPATHDHNTLGGMLGNNSCGVHAVMAGRTVDNTERLEVLTYDGLQMWVGPTSDEEYQHILAEGGRRGEIYRRMKQLTERYADDIRARYPKIPRRVSGYSLDELLPENGFNVARALVGSESTLVTVLRAELRLVPSPPHRVLLILGYDDIFEAADHVVEVRQTGVVGLEGIDDKLIQFMKKKGLHPDDAKLLPDGGGWLIAEYGGDTPEQAEQVARQARDRLKSRSSALYTDKRQQARIWEIRESGLGATANVPGQPLTWPGWEDAAVAPAGLGDYLRKYRQLLDRFGYDCSIYGHFGDGCVHCRIDFDLFTREGIDKYLAFTAAAADLVVQHGGSLSGEHGDGQARGPLLEKMFGPRVVEAFREFKTIWDPSWNMNPGKKVDAYGRDENLRLGAHFHPPKLETVQAFHADEGSFSRAALRCVGVGKCRRTDGGVMCPSFMATLEEKHSTRGRARLLFEMVHGGPIDDRWRSDAIWEALDLCLSCKGCKHDCPVNVDMSAYKAEFAHHHFKGGLRPRHAYGLGLITWWARAASLAPGLANWSLRAPGLSRAAKWAANVELQREFPRFADKTFVASFPRGAPADTGRRVVLFADTFNNHFHPQVAWAAARVLQRAGYSVHVPSGRLCCGRPLFAWGWLGMARRWLGNILGALEGDIRAGTPVVVLEPACASTFKDELQELYPDDERARKLGQLVVSLPDLLMRETDWAPPRYQARALVQPHCHQHAVLGLDGMRGLMERMGLEYDIPPAGCCGMAGSFGFEAPHYDVAMACGERVLLPAVRDAGNALIIADGFSCREQIVQATGRQVLHIAEVLDRAYGD
ncbi:MAG TPA: FAD-binding and (Fe-S)-binding domain-containing protein [Magnetospirillum sp.]|nr:FAD-binding and (Fe-S)-binding domain-containing protein [Magnetospirillum sp.]